MPVSYPMNWSKFPQKNLLPALKRLALPPWCIVDFANFMSICQYSVLKKAFLSDFSEKKGGIASGLCRSAASSFCFTESPSACRVVTKRQGRSGRSDPKAVPEPPWAFLPLSLSKGSPRMPDSPSPRSPRHPLLI